MKKYYQEHETGSYQLLLKFKSSISEDTTIAEFICSYKKVRNEYLYRVIYTGDSTQLIFDGNNYYSVYTFYKKFRKYSPSKSTNLNYKEFVEQLPPCNLAELINKLKDKSHIVIKDSVYIASINNTLFKFDRSDEHLKKITEINFSKEGLQFKESTINYNSDNSFSIINNYQISDFLKEYTKVGNKEFLNQPKISKNNIGIQFPLFNIQSVSGVKYTNTSVLGKFFLIDLFYEACMPCIQSIPYLNELKDKYPNSMVIGIDPVLSDSLNILRFINRYHIKYDIVVGNSARTFWNLIQSNEYPTILLINPEGILTLLHSGYSINTFKNVANKLNN